MAYIIIIKRSAQKQIRSIDEPYVSAIEKAILSLENVPRSIGCKKLAGSKNIFRIRVEI